jgi:hypothetical protein
MMGSMRNGGDFASTLLRKASRRRSRVVALIASMLAIGSLAACGDPAPPRSRVLVIGIDGASPRVMKKLLAEAKLPHLSALARRGVYGRLRSEPPLFSPRVWNTIATGKHPREHGIRAFVFEDAGANRLYTSEHRKVPAIWNILSHAGWSVSVVNWWTTYPPEEIDGVMVSDHFFPERLAGLRGAFSAVDTSSGALVTPADYSEKARAARDNDDDLATFPHAFGPETPLSPWVDREDLLENHRTDHAVTRVALEVQREHAPDALFVFLPGIDRVSHALWGNLEPETLYPPEYQPTPRDRAGGLLALYTYYQVTDALIGSLLQGYGEADHILVVSDHGFEGGTVLAPLTGQHKGAAALHGIVFAAGPKIEPAARIATTSIYDVMPMLLAFADLPGARDLADELPDFVKASPIPRIDTWDDTPVHRIAQADTGMEEEIVERLRALGYLEDGVEPPANEADADSDLRQRE